MVHFEGDDELARVDVTAVGVLARSEVEAQLQAAHRYPRSVKRYLDEALALVTMTEDVAESCLYALPRDGKMIAGPSVRMAEICASAYGNLHIGSRIIEEGETSVVAQGIAWDLQKNVRFSVEVRRRITTKTGKRYGDDMIITTGNAAASIALRNAIFRVIPRSLIQPVYLAARACSVGDLKTLGARRAELFARLGKIGVTPERVLGRLGKAMIDVGLDDLEVLIALGSAITDRSMTVDDAFPPVAASVPQAEEGRRVSLRGSKAAAAPAQAAPSDEPPLGALAEDKREPGSDG